jgi:hypothetical protein
MCILFLVLVAALEIAYSSSSQSLASIRAMHPSANWTSSRDLRGIEYRSVPLPKFLAHLFSRRLLGAKSPALDVYIIHPDSIVMSVQNIRLETVASESSCLFSAMLA